MSISRGGVVAAPLRVSSWDAMRMRPVVDGMFLSVWCLQSRGGFPAHRLAGLCAI